MNNIMNMHGMNQPVGVQGNPMGMPGVGPGGVPGGIMQQPSPQQIQQQQQGMAPAAPPEKLDNISKVKSLMPSLRESLGVTLKTAGQVLVQNNLVDGGSLKGVDLPVPRFDKNLEEFYSICDQIELHLKTSIQCINQSQSSQHYLPLAVAPTRTEPLPPSEVASLTYPQYLATVRAQVSYAKEIHDTLVAAAQNISE